MAKGAGDAGEKGSWLRIADAWRRMIRRDAKPEEEENAFTEQTVGAQQSPKSGKTDSSRPN